MYRLRTKLFELEGQRRTLVELADMLNVSVSHLSRMREGKRGINGWFIVSALTAFPQYRFDDLFYIEEV